MTPSHAPRPPFSHAAPLDLPIDEEFPFDPTHGFDLDRLLGVGPPADEPPDFDRFWTDRYACARAIRVDPEVRPVAGPDDDRTDGGTRVFDLTYGSTDGRRRGGWLVMPVDTALAIGAVVGHGYGGRDRPDAVPAIPGAAILYPCCRGMSRSREPEVPEPALQHVLHGIEDPETYVHGGCVEDTWCAVTALTELVPEVADRIIYVGGSFGGGIGALALPWDRRIRAAHLHVPSFGNHPLRLGLECTGSGAAVRERYRTNPSILRTLAYHDAATAARRARVPVQVAAAILDPVVPPAGQFAIHNALGGPRELIVLRAGHYRHSRHDEEEAARLAAVRRLAIRTG